MASPAIVTHQASSWSSALTLMRMWTMVVLLLVGGPSGVNSQAPPSPLPPTMAPTPAPVTFAPSPLPPTMAPTPAPITNAPSPLPPTMAPTPAPVTFPPSPLPPTEAPSPATVPPTTQPPQPHPDDKVRFYLLDIRVACAQGGSVSTFGHSSNLRSRVKEVVDILAKASNTLPGLRLNHVFKVIGEPSLLAVFRCAGTDVLCLYPLHKIESQLCDLGLTLTLTSMASLEAFAQSLGVSTSLTLTSSAAQLNPDSFIHCYTVQFDADVLSTASSATAQLKKVLTLLLQQRASGQALVGYKLLAVDPVQLFLCANTALDDFDRFFLDLWSATGQPDVTSITRVREVQSVQRYLNPPAGGSVCSGFWCSSIW